MIALHGDQRQLKTSKFADFFFKKKKDEEISPQDCDKQHHISADWISLSFIFFLSNTWKKKFFFTDT